jgi:hypothetical protein
MLWRARVQLTVNLRIHALSDADEPCDRSAANQNSEEIQRKPELSVPYSTKSHEGYVLNVHFTTFLLGLSSVP